MLCREIYAQKKIVPSEKRDRKICDAQLVEKSDQQRSTIERNCSASRDVPGREPAWHKYCAFVGQFHFTGGAYGRVRTAQTRSSESQTTLRSRTGNRR